MSQKPFKILGIEHIGIAVENFDGLSTIFSDIFGLKNIGSEEVIDQHVLTEIFDTGRGKLEFLQATNPKSPITRFINNQGEGMHHIALLVDQLEPALDYLTNKGIKLIDKIPRVGAEGFSIAFLHPVRIGSPSPINKLSKFR